MPTAQFRWSVPARSLSAAAGLFLLLSAPVLAQVFEVTGGSSSLFDATGGSVVIHGATSDISVGLGSLAGRVRFGGAVRTPLGGNDLTVGDNYIPFRLPTDIFDDSHYFLGQGAGITAHRERLDLFSFAGATSAGYETPYFRGTRASKAVGLLFLDARITPKLRFFSRQILSSQQTAIEGVKWEPARGVQGALAAGLGANQGYGSSTLALERGWLSLKAGYILAGRQFRRVSVQTPLSAEADRGNIVAQLRPNHFLTLTAGHQNFLQALPGRETFRAAVNHFSASAKVAGFSLSGSRFESQVRGVPNSGTSLSVSRDFAGIVQVAFYSFHSSSGGNHTESASTLWTAREKISQRLTLAHYVNQTHGRTSISFGGEFTSNRLSMGVDYQTFYVPFRTSSPFMQAVILNIRLQPFGNYQINAGTYLAPDGRTKYTAYGSDFLYRNEPNGASTTFRFPKYVITGRVVDERGNPVRGAAVLINRGTVFTDSAGAFLVRTGRNKPCSVKVLLQEFLAPGMFEVASAPEACVPSKEDVPSPFTIVVRHVKPLSSVK
jgi:hypothetical protein